MTTNCIFLLYPDNPVGVKLKLFLKYLLNKLNLYLDFYSK